MKTINKKILAGSLAGLAICGVVGLSVFIADDIQKTIGADTPSIVVPVDPVEPVEPNDPVDPIDPVESDDPVVSFVDFECTDVYAEILSFGQVGELNMNRRLILFSSDKILVTLGQCLDGYTVICYNEYDTTGSINYFYHFEILDEEITDTSRVFTISCLDNYESYDIYVCPEPFTIYVTDGILYWGSGEGVNMPPDVTFIDYAE